MTRENKNESAEGQSKAASRLGNPNLQRIVQGGILSTSYPNKAEYRIISMMHLVGGTMGLLLSCCLILRELCQPTAYVLQK